MKLTHVLGHNRNWNVDIFNEQELGDYFLLTAFSIGKNLETKPRYKNISHISMLDLQFYAKKNSLLEKGNLHQFEFHPCHIDPSHQTNVYFINCIKQAIAYQEQLNFKNIIIPHFYEETNVNKIVEIIKEINTFIKNNRKPDTNYFMTLALANELIKDDDKVEQLLFVCTDMEIAFDGYFIACESKPKFKQKITVDYDVLYNLARVFKTLKNQEFKTIYAYANFDALILLAVTDIDYITIGTYENLRNFNLERFTEEGSGGPSDGFYFSEKLLNIIRPAKISAIRRKNLMNLIRNETNIFSDIILDKDYSWNIHKPEVNKNYLLSIGQLLKSISDIQDMEERKQYILKLIDKATENYNILATNNIMLDPEEENYHLNIWKTFLLDN